MLCSAATDVESILNEGNVPLRTGPPTREELLVYYPAKFTWTQLKIFVNSGDLGLLKRDQKLQQRYDEWATRIVAKYGSIVNYLVNYRLQWGKPDTQSLLPSSLEADLTPYTDSDGWSDTPEYFSYAISPKYVSIIQNDWPYSVPAEVEHSLIWTRVPIFHPKLVAESVKARIDQDGLWGFTGSDEPPPSPSLLPASMGALSEWGITIDRMVKSGQPSPEEATLIGMAGQHVHRYVQMRWRESEWETAWFVNPPRLQSVPGLAHIHVFARRK